jgi:iron(III) transport system ATP-binding protein
MANLQVSILRKSFAGNPVLRDISFSAPSGSMTAILGASGSGKTTLLRLIAGFEAVDAGEIRIDGELVASATMSTKPESRGIGYVAQEGALFPHLSVADNISFGLPRAQRRQQLRVAELLDLVDLPSSYAGRAPHQLSGGEQQRVALARALAPNPKLILLDEPFSALDAGLRTETREAVAAALKQAGATAILVTHDQAEALSMGQCVGVLRAGHLAQMADPVALYRRPIDVALAGFVGDAVISPGLAFGEQVQCALGILHLSGETRPGAVEVLIRPEQIKLQPNAAKGGVPARIDDVVFFGHDAVVRLHVEGGGAANITARIFSHAVPALGSDVWLTVEGNVVAYPA